MRRVSAIRRTLPLLRLPLRVARFFFRARRLAARTGDDWSLASATHPEQLAVLLRLARGDLPGGGDAARAGGVGGVPRPPQPALSGRRRGDRRAGPLWRGPRRHLRLAGAVAARQSAPLSSAGMKEQLLAVTERAIDK